MAPAHEHVLVYPRAVLEELGAFTGLCADAGRYVDTILSPEHLSWLLRETAEADPSYKQIIPYVVLTHGRSVFSYTRGKGSGEQRLVAQRSVGIGGHIAQEDLSLFTTFGPELFEAAMHREVEEEIVVDAPYTERLLGVINDDETPVGRVHFGIVHVWDVAEPNVQKREAQITRAGFVPIETLLRERDTLETWSLFCVEALAADWGIDA